VDACLIALLLELNEKRVGFTREWNWRPILKESLADYLLRTSLRDDVMFNHVYSKITAYLTSQFARAQNKDDLKLKSVNKNGELVYYIDKDNKTIDLIMLTPFLPFLCYKYWGGHIGQMLMIPLLESRIFQGLSYMKDNNILDREFHTRNSELLNIKTSIGTVTILYCKSQNKNCTVPWIIDFEALSDVTSPNSINRLLKQNNNGIGYTIFRDNSTHSIVLSKGDHSENAEWEQICYKLIELEGESSISTRPCGCWHITKNPRGIAGFLLNGNPTHQYIPKSAITAFSLRDIVDDIRMKT
jgi:hypothetical protein